MTDERAPWRAFPSLPRSLSRRSSRKGVMGLWDDMAKKVYSPLVLSDLPPFAERLAKTFWQVGSEAAVDAIRAGDPAHFIAFIIRLDQIDAAMAAAGKGLAEKSTIAMARHIVDGFRQAAEEQLVKAGGSWPPAPPTASPEEPGEGSDRL